MYSYILSDLRSTKEKKIKIKQKDIMEKLVVIPSKSSLSILERPKNIPVGETKNDKNFIYLKLGENLKLEIFDTIIDSELTTDIVINTDNYPFLIYSSPRGLGIIKWGGGRRYIDKYIGPTISKVLFGNDEFYNPIEFQRKKMKWKSWGSNLRKIKLNIPEIGRLVLSGKELESVIYNPEWKEIIKKSTITGFSIYDNNIKRVIEITNNGVIKSRISNIIPIVNFVNDKILKLL